MSRDIKQVKRKKTSGELLREIGKLNYILDEALDESGGEVTEKAEEILAELETMSTDAMDKIGNIISFIEYLDENAAAQEAVAEKIKERYDERMKKVKNIAKRRRFLSDRIHRLMQEMGERKIKVDGKAVWIQEYEKLVLQDLEEDDEAAIIEAGYGEVRKKNYIDKKALKKAVQEDTVEAIETLRSMNKISLEISESLRGV